MYVSSLAQVQTNLNDILDVNTDTLDGFISSYIDEDHRACSQPVAQVLQKNIYGDSWESS